MTLVSATGHNGYAQSVSNGSATLDLFAAAASGNPIAKPALAQSFSFKAQPFSSPGPGEPQSRIIFSDGSTNILADVNTVSYSSAVSFNDIVKGVSTSLGGRLLSTTLKPTNIGATFTPNFGLTVAQAEAAGGYSALDWQQTITDYPDNRITACANSACSETIEYSAANVPFKDPPLYGYPGCNGSGQGSCSESYPFYYNAFKLADTCAEFIGTFCAERVLGSNELNFFDSPGSPGLVDGDAVEFETRLVGVLPTFVPDTGQDCVTSTPATCEVVGPGFDWIDTFTGGDKIFSGNGGIIPLLSDGKIPLTNGSGGITITRIVDVQSLAVPELSTTVSFSLGMFVVALMSLQRKLRRAAPRRAIPRTNW